MRKILASLAIICMFWQCSPCRHCPAAHTPATSQWDSVRVEYRERLVHDTVEFVPPEFYASQTSKDTVSVIENDYAKTTAVWHDGLLSHDLQSKPTIIRIPVVTEVHDTLVYQGEERIISQSVEVEKKLSLWQKIRLNGFWVLLIFAVWGFRGSILKLIRKIL